MTAKPTPTSRVKRAMKDGSLAETRLWRGSQTLLIGGLMWMVDQNFTSKEQFADYKTSHQLWGETKLSNIDEKLERLSRVQESISNELRAMNRQQREAAQVLPRK